MDFRYHLQTRNCEAINHNRRAMLSRQLSKGRYVQQAHGTEEAF